MFQFRLRLRESRVRCGYTQQNLADQIGVALRSYQKYEQGVREPSFELLVQIADFLDVSTDYLLGRDEYLKAHGACVDE